jgi:hypothetical protein
MIATRSPADSPPLHDTVADLARRYRTHPSCITRHLIKGWTDKRTCITYRPEGVLRGPGRWYVPAGAYEDFLRRVAAARMGTPAPDSPAASAARERELARVDAELESIGI